MTHPIVACASDIRASLKGVAGVNPTFMSTEDKAAALQGLVRAEAQLAELRLRVLADAGDLAGRPPPRTRRGGWPMRRGCGSTRPAPTWRSRGAGPEHPVVAAAMRDGDVDCRAGAGDPPCPGRAARQRGRGQRRAAEAHLVGEAAVFGPKELARLGRHVLDVVARRSPRRPRLGGWPSSRPTPLT